MTSMDAILSVAARYFWVAMAGPKTIRNADIPGPAIRAFLLLTLPASGEDFGGRRGRLRVTQA
jgi:hypothetical protein